MPIAASGPESRAVRPDLVERLHWDWQPWRRYGGQGKRGQVFSGLSLICLHSRDITPKLEAALFCSARRLQLDELEAEESEEDESALMASGGSGCPP